MVKFINHIELTGLEASQQQTDPTKGTVTNPYTQEEHDAFASGTWPGGYVEGVGYVVPDRQVTALESSYPDTGNVMYPGIFVEAGRFKADHQEFFGVSDNTINVWWDSGFTGNFNLLGDPEWFHSNISADSELHGSNGITTANWAKIEDGVYKVEVHHRLSEMGQSLECKEFTLEQLQRGVFP